MSYSRSNQIKASTPKVNPLDPYKDKALGTLAARIHSREWTQDSWKEIKEWSARKVSDDHCVAFLSAVWSSNSDMASHYLFDMTALPTARETTPYPVGNEALADYKSSTAFPDFPLELKANKSMVRKLACCTAHILIRSGIKRVENIYESLDKVARICEYDKKEHLIRPTHDFISKISAFVTSYPQRNNWYKTSIESYYEYAEGDESKFIGVGIIVHGFLYGLTSLRTMWEAHKHSGIELSVIYHHCDYVGLEHVQVGLYKWLGTLNNEVPPVEGFPYCRLFDSNYEIRLSARHSIQVVKFCHGIITQITRVPVPKLLSAEFASSDNLVMAGCRFAQEYKPLQAKNKDAEKYLNLVYKKTGQDETDKELDAI